MTLMPLSEAMRLGAMTSKQGFGDIVDEFGGRCALAAAHEAVGLLDQLHAGGQYPEPWRALLAGTVPASPCGCCAQCSVDMVVMHLNDTHGWTRERIADWVATVEAQVQQPTEAMA